MGKGLLEKTGQSLDHWIKIVEATGIGKHKAIIDHLKSEHGFTYGYANFVAMKARKADAASHDADDLVAAQYIGKESLKPIYEKLLKTIGKFGSDITITPKKDSVSCIRKKQFALIKPATKSRLDLGLKLKGKPTTKRLKNSGPFGTMCTHRVRLEKAAEVNPELIAWLKEAYQAAI